MTSNETMAAIYELARQLGRIEYEMEELKRDVAELRAARDVPPRHRRRLKKRGNVIQFPRRDS